MTTRQSADESYGLYESQRKARNGLSRLVRDKRLCCSFLGIAEEESSLVRHVPANMDDAGRMERLRQLTRALTALAPLRVEAWPYGGAIGIRERADVHIVHDWRYLATARNEAGVDEVLQTRATEFDEDSFKLLSKKVSHLSERQIIRFPPAAGAHLSA